MPLFVRIRPMNRAELGNATILRGSCTGLKGVGTPCQPGEPPPKTSHHPSPTLLTLQPCTSTGLSPPGTLDATLPPLHLLTDGIIMPTPTNPEEEQRGVFNLWSPHISACVLQGRSACCIAYGPSGTGKTYTMLGEAGRPGLIPRTAALLLRGLTQRYGSSSGGGGMRVHVEASYLEVYNDKVYDLLSALSLSSSSPSAPSTAFTPSPPRFPKGSTPPTPVGSVAQGSVAGGSSSGEGGGSRPSTPLHHTPSPSPTPFTPQGVGGGVFNPPRNPLCLVEVHGEDAWATGGGLQSGKVSGHSGGGSNGSSTFGVGVMRGGRKWSGGVGIPVPTTTAPAAAAASGGSGSGSVRGMPHHSTPFPTPVAVVGMGWHPANTPNEVGRLVVEGGRQRAMRGREDGSGPSNSSRSHAIFTLRITIGGGGGEGVREREREREREGKEGESGGPIPPPFPLHISNLTLVDCAGCEKGMGGVGGAPPSFSLSPAAAAAPTSISTLPHPPSAAIAAGRLQSRILESGHIASSLSALGQALTALATRAASAAAGGDKVVPDSGTTPPPNFALSTLTRLLAPALLPKFTPFPTSIATAAAAASTLASGGDGGGEDTASLPPLPHSSSSSPTSSLVLIGTVGPSELTGTATLATLLFLAQAKGGAVGEIKWGGLLNGVAPTFLSPQSGGGGVGGGSSTATPILPWAGGGIGGGGGVRPTTTPGFLANYPPTPAARAVTPFPHSTLQQQQLQLQHQQQPQSQVYGAMSPYISYNRSPSALATATATATGVGTRVIEVPADTPPLQQQQVQVQVHVQPPLPTPPPPPFYYHTNEKRVRIGEEEGRDNGIFMPCSTRYVVPALWGEGGMNAAAAAAAAWARGTMSVCGGGGKGGKGKGASAYTHATNPPPFYPNKAMRLSSITAAAQAAGMGVWSANGSGGGVGGGGVKGAGVTSPPLPCQSHTHHPPSSLSSTTTTTTTPMGAQKPHRPPSTTTVHSMPSHSFSSYAAAAGSAVPSSSSASSSSSSSSSSSFYPPPRGTSLSSYSSTTAAPTSSLPHTTPPPHHPLSLPLSNDPKKHPPPPPPRHAHFHASSSSLSAGGSSGGVGSSSTTHSLRPFSDHVHARV